MVSRNQLSKTELCLDPSRKGTNPQIAALGRLPTRLFGEIPTRVRDLEFKTFPVFWQKSYRHEESMLFIWYDVFLQVPYDGRYVKQ